MEFLKLWGPNSNIQFKKARWLNVDPKLSVGQVMQIRRNGSEQIILPYLLFPHYKKRQQKRDLIYVLCIFVDIPENWKWKKIHSSYQCQSYEKDWLFSYISVGIDKFWNHCELSPANLWPPTLLLLCTSGIQSKVSPSVSTAISLACYSEHKSPKTRFSENFQCLHFVFPLSSCFSFITCWKIAYLLRLFS